MKFIAEKNELLNDMNLVKQAINAKTTNPILKTIYVEAKDGMLKFRGNNTNLDISIITAVDSIVDEGICCVDSLLIDLLNNFQEGEVTFSLKKRLTVSQKSRKHQLVFMDHENYPDTKEIKNYEKIDPTELFTAFNVTSTSIRQLPDRAELQGIHINPHSNFMITGDGFRISLYENLKLPGNISAPKGKVVLPLLNHLNSLGDKDQFEVSLGEWNGFKITRYDDDGTFAKQIEVIFSSVAGEFPLAIKEKIEELRSGDTGLSVVVEKKELQKVLSICKLYADRAYADGGSEPVYLQKIGSKIKMDMQIKGLVDMSETLRCKFTGEYEEKISFNPSMLLETISNCNSDKLELRFYDSKTPFILLDNDMENFSYLQTLMALPEVENVD